jgi:EAL domain-containing protein (putative c-di-GMP-specific phosphodiesterase class I)
VWARTGASRSSTPRRSGCSVELPPAQPGLEIAESGLTIRSRSTADQFRALHALGVQLAIDHFGAGGSPLAELTTLPITTLKLDPSLLSNETGTEDDRRARLRAVVAPGQALGIDAWLPAWRRRSRWRGPGLPAAPTARAT